MEKNGSQKLPIEVSKRQTFNSPLYVTIVTHFDNSSAHTVVKQGAQGSSESAISFKQIYKHCR